MKTAQRDNRLRSFGIYMLFNRSSFACSNVISGVRMPKSDFAMWMRSCTVSCCAGILSLGSEYEASVFFFIV